VSIQPMAKCDGPGCEVVVQTERDEYPDTFIVVDLLRARDGLSHGTGQYGFCSRACFGAWVTWTKR
jgi:hypothetical protein